MRSRPQGQEVRQGQVGPSATSRYAGENWLVKLTAARSLLVGRCLLRRTARDRTAPPGIACSPLSRRLPVAVELSPHLTHPFRGLGDQGGLLRVVRNDARPGCTAWPTEIDDAWPTTRSRAPSVRDRPTGIQHLWGVVHAFSVRPVDPDRRDQPRPASVEKVPRPPAPTWSVSPQGFELSHRYQTCTPVSPRRVRSTDLGSNQVTATLVCTSSRRNAPG
jgi:hypothetical protein